MKRYEMEHTMYLGDSMEPAEDGDWVRFDDPDIAAGQLAIERMRALSNHKDGHLIIVWAHGEVYSSAATAVDASRYETLDALADAIIEAERGKE